jgi:hypothetical protein
MANKLVFSKFEKKVLVIDSRKQAIGSLTLYKRWGKHIFTPITGSRLSGDHLEDILDQLSKLDTDMALKGPQNDKKAGS